MLSRVITNTHQQTIRYHRPGDEDALKIAKYILTLYRKIANYILTLLRVETTEKIRYRDQPYDGTSCYQNIKNVDLPSSSKWIKLKGLYAKSVHGTRNRKHGLLWRIVAP
jgi:hypothetical protein